jgi:type I restriction enzyme S subunit
MTVWLTKKLGEICSIKNGKSDTQDAVEDGEFAFFDRSKTIKKSNRYLFDCEALIIPGEGTEFLPKFYSGKFDLHQRAYALHNFKSNVDIQFIYYYLIYLKDYFPSVAVGATVKSLRMRHFEDMPVIIPPLSEQQRIVAILDEAFAGLDKAMANTERNLANVQDTFQLYLDEAFDTEQRGWDSLKISEVSDINYGYTEKASSEKVGPKFLRITDIQDGQVNWETVPYCKIDSKAYEKQKLLNADIVFARTGATTGKSFLVKNPPDAVSASYLIRLRIKTGTYVPEFLSLFFQTKYYWNAINAGISGSAQGGFNASKLGELVVPIPSMEEQNSLVEKVQSISVEIDKLKQFYSKKNLEIANLKQSLLRQAFTGKLKDRIVAVTPASDPIQLHAQVICLAYSKHEETYSVDTFGHVKAEKVVHMVEALTGCDLGRSPLKQAAGPYDSHTAVNAREAGRRNGYFKFNQRNISGGYVLEKGPKFEHGVASAKQTLAPHIETIEPLMAAMARMNSEKAEIFATTYAAWNNLLLDGKSPSEEEIVTEAREGWHKQKLNISRDKFFNMIKWIRDNDMVPKGTGKRVEDI